MPHVYVNSFGSHRCGSLIRCGRGYKWADVGQSRILLSEQSPVDRSRGQRAAKARGDKADPKPSAAAVRVQAVESCGGVKDTSLCRGTCLGTSMPWESMGLRSGPCHVFLFSGDTISVWCFGLVRCPSQTVHTGR